MSQCPRRAWCGAMGCISRRTPRPSPSAARRLGNRRWSPHQPWTGRPCVRSVGRPILSGVLPAGSASCALGSSHGEEHLPACPQRHAPHEIRTTGETSQGRRVPGGGQGTEGNSLEGVLRGGRCTRHGHCFRPCGVSSACHRPHDGGWPPGKLHSARLPNPAQAASGRGPSNQVLSEVLRAGRESTAGLSPLSTPDSILICYRKEYIWLLPMGVVKAPVWYQLTGVSQVHHGS